jgi:ketosteroid isomerase-like protein
LKTKEEGIRMETAAAKEVRLKLEEYYKAFHEKDWKKFSDILTEDFKYFTDGCVVQPKNDFVEFLKKDPWQGIDYKISALEIQTASSIDLAFAVYKISFRGTVEGSERKLDATETTLFVKDKHEWRIFHCHTSNKM